MRLDDAQRRHRQAYLAQHRAFGVHLTTALARCVVETGPAERARDASRTSLAAAPCAFLFSARSTFDAFLRSGEECTGVYW
eukprot:145242-Pyramimonas_sp.AAC.1